MLDRRSVMKKNIISRSEASGLSVHVALGLIALTIGAFIIAILVRGGAWSCSIASAPAAMTAETDLIRAKAPDFTLKGLSGEDISLSDFTGKVVVVSFWATWCGPCRAEIPSFVKLRDQYHDKGFEIIGISVDGDDTGEVAEFARRFKISYPIVMGTMETIKSYGPINAIPTTFIIDRKGKVHSRYLGMLSFEELESEVKDLL